jgi:hypothetical protein
MSLNFSIFLVFLFQLKSSVYGWFETCHSSMIVEVFLEKNKFERFLGLRRGTLVYNFCVFNNFCTSDSFMFSDLHFETEVFPCFLFLLGLICPPMSEDFWFLVKFYKFLVSTFSRSECLFCFFSAM